MDTAFDKADIEDFYTHNSDGVGVMWSENDILYTRKYLPPTAEAAWAFYQEHIRGRECVVHWRMKTHGLIDLENCHPYPIFGAGTKMPMSLMHNGVLSTGNAADKTKSDTWHYVADYLRPLLNEHPEMFLNPVVQKLLQDHIGYGNRFIIMNHKGEMAILNEKDFVTYKGAKLSNTYAWSSEKGGFGYSRSRKSGSLLYGDDYWNDYEYTPGSWKKPEDEKPSTKLESSLFFQLLKEQGFNRAYYDLTFSEVEVVIEDISPAMWNNFLQCIEQDLLTDEEISLCVHDVEGCMVPFLYGDEEEDDGQTKTEGDLHREEQERIRAEEMQRVQDELLAIQAFYTHPLPKHVAELGVN